MEIKEIKAGNRAFGFQRRNLYPFLSKEEIESWMNDEGDLRVRWYEIREDQKRVGLIAWEIYDIHQYVPGDTRYIILDCYTFEVEKKFRGTGLGRELFLTSLNETIKEVASLGFRVGAIMAETHSAQGFYSKAFAAMNIIHLKEEVVEMAGHRISKFWAQLA